MGRLGEFDLCTGTHNAARSTMRSTPRPFRNRSSTVSRCDTRSVLFAAFATRADGTIQQDHYVIATFVC